MRIKIHLFLFIIHKYCGTAAIRFSSHSRAYCIYKKKGDVKNSPQRAWYAWKNDTSVETDLTMSRPGGRLALSGAIKTR